MVFECLGNVVPQASVCELFKQAKTCGTCKLKNSIKNDY